MGKIARISEVQITQGDNNPVNINVPDNLIGVTVECTPDSSTNVWLGWNENATNKNVLTPGDSKSYGNIEGIYLDGNKLQVNFDNSLATVGGKCLITFLLDTTETCD